jgi:hypothetical protein
MLAGLDDPDREDTPAQARFRQLCATLGATPDPANPLTHRLSDYIGHSLPECRVSDAVCRMRPGFVPTVRRTGVRVA